MLVVSDTAPIRCLAHLNHTNLLRLLYGTVYVPPAVAAELFQVRPRFPGVDVTQIAFVIVRAPSDANQVAQFLQTLDLGESEALALAMEMSATVVLIDEDHGRKVALQHGLSPVGTLGVLLRAKTAGHIPLVRPLVDRLIQDLGFFVSAGLYSKVLKTAAE